MNDSSTLGLLFEIAADPTKANEALNLFDEQAQISAQRIQIAMENARTAIQDGFGQTAAAADLAAAGLTESAAKMAAAELEARMASDALKDSQPPLQEELDETAVSADAVELALGTAFSAVAVLGLVGILTTQLPHALEVAEEYLSGWDQAAQKAFEDEQEKVRKLADEFIRFEGSLAKAQGKDPIAKQLEEQNQQLDQATAKWTALRHQLDQSVSIGASEGGVLFPTHKLEEEMKLVEKDIDHIRKTIDDLNRQAEKARAEDEAQTAKWFERKIGEADRFHEQQAKKAEEAARKEFEAAKKHGDEQLAYVAHLLKNREELEKDAAATERTLEQTRLERSNLHTQLIEKNEEQVTRELEKNTRARVKLILDEYKERERIVKQHEKIENEAIRASEQYEHRVMQEKMQMWRQFESVGLNALSHLHGAQKLWGEAAIRIITEVMMANLQKDLQEQKGILVKSALKAKEQAADAIAAFARYDFWAGAEHLAAAAAYGALAAEPIISAAIGVAGVGGGGGGGGSFSGSPGGAPGLPPAMAGGAGPGGNVHVVILGPSDSAQWMHNLIRDGIRYNNLGPIQ